MKVVLNISIILLSIQMINIDKAHSIDRCDFLKTPSSYCGEFVTNPFRDDGFGAQFQTIIYSVIYAELNNKKFIYNPFVKMEHNYNNDPWFIYKKEKLINFIDNFEINKNIELQTQQKINPRELINFFEAHLEESANSASLKKIKEIFRLNKIKKDFFKADQFNIAIHVRRANPHDNRIAGTDTPDEVYLNIIELLKALYNFKKPCFHIFSQGNIDYFKSIFNQDNTILHINESVEQTFSSMVFADVLVTSPSSLSYTAALLSEGTVYYIPFWHPPLPNWISIEDIIPTMPALIRTMEKEK